MLILQLPAAWAMLKEPTSDGAVSSEHNSEDSSQKQSTAQNQ